MTLTEQHAVLNVKRWLTGAEAALYLGITRNALDLRVSRGTLPAWCYSHVGRSIHFNRESLDQWLAGDASRTAAVEEVKAAKAAAGLKLVAAR